MFIFLKQEIPFCCTMQPSIIHINFLLKFIQHVPINGFPNPKSVKKAEKSPCFKESLVTCALKISQAFKEIQMPNFFFSNILNMSSTYNVLPFTNPRSSASLNFQLKVHL